MQSASAWLPRGEKKPHRAQPLKSGWGSKSSEAELPGKQCAWHCDSHQAHIQSAVWHRQLTGVDGSADKCWYCGTDEHSHAKPGGPWREKGTLLRPCQCRGTIFEAVHEACLAKWVQHTGINSCAQCQAKYSTEKSGSSTAVSNGVNSCSLDRFRQSWYAGPPELKVLRHTPDPSKAGHFRRQASTSEVRALIG